MRVRPFNKETDRCHNCQLWVKVPGMMQNGKPIGECRLYPVKPITQLINIQHVYESKLQFEHGMKQPPQVGTQMTSQILCGFPTIVGDSWCYEHVKQEDA
ncbi:MAG: hypothetical protein C5B59_17355 [Bacteroidetes bacterium]|nr:MAG: hypothetical protein C5B59_17355 [Bacteroidota bacterium]